MPPRVTVFCPIYNDAKYIDDLIPSVLNQSYEDFEFLILENGSTDDTRSRLARYQDPRIRVITSHINLRSETATHILQTVESQYIAPIYADDEFLPSKLERSLQALEHSGADACFSNTLFMGEQKQPVSPNAVPRSMFSGDISLMSKVEHLYHFAKYGNSLHPVSLVINTGTLHALGGFRGDMHQVGDMDFFARLLLRKNVIFLSDKLQKIRIRDGGRNESTVSDDAMNKIRGERINFFNNYRSSEALELIDKIFLPDARGINVRKEMRLWFLGQQFVNHYEPDCRFFGICCMYDALKENPEAIAQQLTETLGVTPGAYIDQIAPKIFEDFGRRDVSKDRDIQSLSSKITSLESQALVAKQLNLELEDEKAYLQTEVRESYSRVAALETSTSWRATRPLREFGLKLRLLLGRSAVPPSPADEVEAPLYTLGDLIKLGEPSSQPYVQTGLSYPEAWGRWTDGSAAKLSFRPRGRVGAAILEIVPRMIFEPTMAGHKLGIAVNGDETYWSAIEIGKPIRVEVPAKTLAKSKTVTIGILVPHPRSSEIDITDDPRLLGVGLESFTLFRKIPSPRPEA